MFSSCSAFNSGYSLAKLHLSDSFLGVVGGGSTSQHGGGGTPVTDVAREEELLDKENGPPGKISTNGGLELEFDTTRDGGILLSALSTLAGGDEGTEESVKDGRDEKEEVAKDRVLYVVSFKGGGVCFCFA